MLRAITNLPYVFKTQREVVQAGERIGMRSAVDVAQRKELAAPRLAQRAGERLELREVGAPALLGPAAPGEERALGEDSLEDVEKAAGASGLPEKPGPRGARTVRKDRVKDWSRTG